MAQDIAFFQERKKVPGQRRRYPPIPVPDMHHERQTEFFRRFLGGLDDGDPFAGDELCDNTDLTPRISPG